MTNYIDQNKLVVLSPLFQLPESEDVIDMLVRREEEPEEIKQVKDKQLYFLSNKNGNHYLINPTIRIFLQAFHEPRTLKDTILEFAQASNCEPSQIEEVMLQFFKQMKKQSILINLDIAQNLKELLSAEPLEKAKFDIGDTIGRYEVEDIIMVKNASQLYRCKDSLSGEQVVLKTIIYPKELPLKIKKRSLQKFRQEFQFMEEMREHPNVCRLIEYHEEEDFVFAAIEYIEGSSLRSFSKNNELDINERLLVIQQVFAGIAHVQNEGIIHGDIHLSNFIVQKDRQVKLIDFGLSNHQSPQENEILRNGAVYGCVPPERIKDTAFSFLEKRADYRSEVFQLGVVLYYLLYKQYPFKGFTWSKLAQEIKEKMPDFPKTSPEGEAIPSFLLNLLNKALQKEPEQRFSDAQEMLDFLTKEIN